MEAILIGRYNPPESMGMGLYYLKAYADKDPGVNGAFSIKTRFVNDDPGVDSLFQEIFDTAPDVLGFSCHVWNIEWVLGFVHRIRHAGFKGLMVLGGPEVSYTGVEILKANPAVDIAVKGEGEKTFAEILTCIASNGCFEGIGGIVYRQGTGVFENPRALLIKDLALVPSPILDETIDLKATAMQLNSTGTSLAFQTYRGCPFKCSFCGWGGGEIVREFPLARVTEELDMIMASGVNRVWYTDSISNLNRERFRRILEHINKNNKNRVVFDFEIFVELLDDETIELISRLDFLGYLALGLQTSNPAALKNLNRKTDLNKFKTNSVRLRRVNKKTEMRIDIVIGLPGDNFEGFRDTLKFAAEINPHRLQFHNLSLLPGTQFYDQREKFSIKCDAKPPRYVTESYGFSLDDMAKAKDLAARTDNYFSLPEVRLTLLHVKRIEGITLWEAFEGFLLHVDQDSAIVESALLKYFKKAVNSSKSNNDIYARLSDAIAYISTVFGRASMPDTIGTFGSMGRVFEFAVDEMTLYDYFDEDFNISQIPTKRFALGSSPPASAGSDLSTRFRG